MTSQISPEKLASCHKSLAEDGYCVIENLLDADTLKRLQQRFAEQAIAERNLKTGQNHANNARGNQWLGMLLNKGHVFIELIDHPVTTQLIAGVLGRDYTISAFDGHIQHPGSEAMGAHVDQWWMPAPSPADSLTPAADITRSTGDADTPVFTGKALNPAVAASVMFMISDFTAENGATRVYPGSHLSERQPDPDWQSNDANLDDGWKAIEAPAGSAMVFDGRLWHAAGANVTEAERVGALGYYCAPFCRPLENYLVGLHPDARAHCPESVLNKLGFKSWRMYGHTGDLSGVGE